MKFYIIQFYPACNLFLSFMSKYAAMQIVLNHHQFVLLPQGNNTKMQIHTKNSKL